MATLEELRVELDKIDNQMVELYQKRMNVCREVGDYKVKAGRKVYDRQREQEKLADVASKVDNDFDKNGVRELYTQLMSMSRKLQYQKLVDFLLFRLILLRRILPELCSREQKVLTEKRQCISSLEKM